MEKMRGRKRKRRKSLKIKSVIKKLLINWPVKIISLGVAIFLFVFNRMSNLEEQQLYIPLIVKLQDDLAIADPIKDNIYVVIKGDTEKDIKQIRREDIKVFIDLLDKTEEGEYTVPVEYVKVGSILNDLAPLSIELEPDVMRVTLEKRKEKSVEIQIKRKGEPARGYKIEKFTYTPIFAQITGPSSRVKEIENANTEEIDITGRTRSFTGRIKLESVDPVIQYKGGTVVEFNAVIKEIIEEKIFEDEKIILKNLAPSLKIGKPLSEGVIKVKAPLASLDKLEQNDIQLYIDCENIVYPGKVEVQIKPETPENVEVIDFEPKQLIIDFLLQEK
jgi:YbbR domain-containing protein